MNCIKAFNRPESLAFYLILTTKMQRDRKKTNTLDKPLNFSEMIVHLCFFFWNFTSLLWKFKVKTEMMRSLVHRLSVRTHFKSSKKKTLKKDNDFVCFLSQNELAFVHLYYIFNSDDCLVLKVQLFPQKPYFTLLCAFRR